MKYFKNTELAKLYNVSEKSVRNWIESAQQDKLSLELYQKNDKIFIADTMGNSATINELVEKGRKFRNSRGHKIIEPSDEFYELIPTDRIVDIITDLDIYREIPVDYSYFGKGARYWDEYANRLYSEKDTNTLTANIDMLNFNQQAIDTLIDGNQHVNIIDVGPGNALPVRDLLGHLITNGKLKKYIAIDISQDMLDVAEKNVTEWFGDKIVFEGHVRDVKHERFGDVLLGESFTDNSPSTINIILLLGTVITNFREPEQVLHTIRDSMSRTDLLVTFLKLDGEKSRRFFDFSVESDKKDILSTQDRFILDLLNIEPAYYDVEQFFDEHRRSRIIQVRMKVALSVKFRIGDLFKTIELHKNEAIMLWRAWHYTDYEIIGKYDENHFSLLQATKSKDQEYFLLISQIKTAHSL